MRYIVTITLLCTFVHATFSQCPEMDKWLNKVKQGDEKCVQDWTHIAHWYGMECQCYRGWILKDGHRISIPKHEAEALEKMMDDAAARLNNAPHYKDCVPVKLDRYRKCLYGRGEMTIEEYHQKKQQGGSFGGSSAGAAGNGLSGEQSKMVFDDEMRNMLNSWAAESDDTLFREMVKGINENHEWISKFRDFGVNSGVASQRDIEFYDFTEDVAQGIKIGEFLVGKIQQRKKEKEELERQRALIKQQADDYIRQINKQLNGYYTDAAYIPASGNYDEKQLEQIRSYPSRFQLYNEFTAAKRLLVIRYLESPAQMTVNDIRNMRASIETMEKQQGTSAVLTEIDNRTKNSEWYSEYYPFLMNDPGGFKDSYATLYYELGSAYDQLGQKDSAKFYFEKVRQDLTAEAAISLSVRAYKKKRYQVVNKLNPAVESYFTEKGPLAAYPDVRFDYANGLHTAEIRFDRVAYVHFIGIMSLINSGYLENAEAGLMRLKSFIENYQKRIGVKANPRSASYEEQVWVNSLGPDQVKASQLYVQIAENVLMSRKGNIEPALANMKKIATENSMVSLAGQSELTIVDIRFEYLKILIDAGQYQEAIDECYTLMRTDIGQTINKNNMLKDVKFYQAFLELKMDKPDKALTTIQYIEALGEASPKAYRLKADIFAYQGNVEKREMAMEQYRNAIMLNHE